MDEFRFFTALVAARGLSAAARTLESSPAAMSRRLAALEARLSVRLVSRTTRTFELTEEGALFHERCVRIVAEIEEAEAEAAAGGAAPRGLLRVGVPMEIGRRRIAPIVADYTEMYPQVEAHLVLSDSGLNIFEDRVDVSLRVGLPSDQDVVVTRIISSRLVLCAAPSYLQRYGEPAEPADLTTRDCIRLIRSVIDFDRWRFWKDGSVLDIKVRGTLATTSAEVVHDWILSGRGIGLKALWDITGDLESGRLIRCLADHECDEITLSAVYATRKHLPPRVRLFIDFVRERLGRCQSSFDAYGVASTSALHAKAH